MKKLNFVAVSITLIMGALIGGPVGAVAAFGLGMIPRGTEIIQEGLFPEVWTGEMVKAFRHDDQATFLSTISDYSQYAENDVIHLVDVGADPDVLVNNTTYPIDVQELPDQDIAISLHKFQTKATKVTDDELYAIKYDKMASVIERHKAKINETKYDMAIHALAPQSNTTATPVVATTGAVDGTRRKLQKKDVIALKKKFDAYKIPTKGRILVLCSDHVNDMLELDQKFAEQYYNYTDGKIANLYGFQVYEYVNNPYFNGSTKAKKAYGSVVGDEDFQASVAFYAPRMFKAMGSTTTYMSEAKNSPTTQANLVNFRHYYIALPKKQEAIGAIVSTYITVESQSDNTNIEDTSSGAVVTAIGVESITVVAGTDVDTLIGAIDSTDESVQAYAVTTSTGTAKTGTDALVTGYKLVVTAENGEQTNTYVITVAEE